MEPITTHMKRVIAITAAAVMACSSLAWAQSTRTTSQQTGTKSLAQVAKEEEARRQAVRKPAKVYTNGNLPTGAMVDTPPAVPASPAASTTDKPAANSTPSAPGAAAKPGEVKDQAYWAGRMKTAREQLERSQLFADSLQTRINSLWTDFVNRDDPAQKAKLETDRKAALAELERVKKEIELQTKAITALEDEARRAGVPPGWLRPGA